jgi:putative DNA primase/helicase
MEHGFELPKGQQAPAAPSAEELAHRERERAERARIEATHARAAEEVATLWADGSRGRACPYLERKGVQAHGVRVTADGWLPVPCAMQWRPACMKQPAAR